MQKINAKDIGAKAVEVLHSFGPVAVQGVTSKGVFLNVGNRWMVFISAEKFRGPLTINALGFEGDKCGLKQGMAGTYLQDRLLFGEADCYLDLSIVSEWKPVPYPVILPKRKELAAQKADVLAEKYIYHSFDRYTKPTRRMLAELKRITMLVREADLTEVIKIVDTFLGLGSGLTPEGDDLLIGLFYQMRIANNELSRFDLNRFFSIINQLAQRKTTLLSQSLLSCAAQGLVDERISQVLHSIYFDGDGLDRAIKQLYSWGNTSGQMSLAGMLCGIMAGDLGSQRIEQE